ncbi:MAG TPA: FliH/SctL family protein [Conexibacter sp.]|jgi:flagellar assembly protein FliH|nr:FliH/SctL family protein [Conexibacter sp.]
MGEPAHPRASGATGSEPYAFEPLEQPPPVRLRDLESPLAAAQAEAEAIRASARAEGHADGLAAGLEEGRAQVAGALAALESAFGEVVALREATAETVERDAVELAVQLAEKIVAGTLAAEPERVLDVVRGALRRLAERRRVTILVHPDDLELVRAASGGFAGELGGIEHCEVQSERRIARGGAIVRTDEGQVDASVETQLARARELVEAELGPIAHPRAPA